MQGMLRLWVWPVNSIDGVGVRNASDLPLNEVVVKNDYSPSVLLRSSLISPPLPLSSLSFPPPSVAS